MWYGDLAKELKSCVKLEIPFHKAVKVTGTNIETKLRKLFPNAILGHDSSIDEWIVKLMPSGAHGVAANLLMAEIVDQYRVANTTNMSAVCYSSGTQRITWILTMRCASDIWVDSLHYLGDLDAKVWREIGL
ncbi:hypothetical protein B0H14DRAFT_3858059 [Mycena olivaceomarginata]|nr:hypothetical protein B0H14DRAFT_3858059 [Mycena olivaceomarginata]